MCLVYFRQADSGVQLLGMSGSVLSNTVKKEGSMYKTEPTGIRWQQHSEMPFSGGQAAESALPATMADPVEKYASIGIGTVSFLADTLLSYPCIALRRQCQVHRKAVKYHLTPFTLIPVMFKLQTRQGFLTLWKGTGSMIIVRGLVSATESLLAELTPFPREITWHSSIRQIGEHLLLKGLAFGLVTPFLCASFVETVQSDIASERPGVIDCLKEGLCRLLKLGTPQSNRLLPIWMLFVPTATYKLLQYVISSVVQSVTLKLFEYKLRQRLHVTQAHPESNAERMFAELASMCTGNFIADVILYPMETVLHRLYLQGTRTIIDNLDNGTSVTPVLTSYEGPFDCFQCIVDDEGAAGLFKGFGALLLQYGLHAAVLSATKLVLEEVVYRFKHKQTPSTTL